MKPPRSSSRGPMKLLSFLGLALCCGSLVLVSAKPLNNAPPAEQDPMLALPSSGGQPEPPQEVQYMTYQQLPTTQAELQHQHQQANPGAYSNQPYELVEVTPQQSGGQVGPQQHEYTTVVEAQPQQYQGEQERAEYPGQIIYVNDDQARGHGASPPSDLAATILTEVRARDMTPEVLTKLRRDYGVKVVATREQPGANLMINCDEYPAQENSICSKQTSQVHAPSYNQQENQHQPQHYQPRRQQPQELQPQQPPTAELPSSDHHSLRISHMGQPVGEQVAHVYEQASALPQQEGQSGEAQPREVVTYVSGQDQQAVPQPTEAADDVPQGNEHEHEHYGARTTPSANEQPAGEADVEASPQPTPTDQPAIGEPEAEHNRSSSAPESYEQGSGFDEQPKSEGAEQTRPETNPNGEYYIAQS